MAPLLLQDPAVSEVVGLDLRASPVPARSKWVPVSEDIRSPAARDLLKGIDCLVHLAFVVRNIHDDARAREVNLEGTENLLAGAAEHGVGHVVFTSSAAVYGCRPDNPPFVPEDWPLRPDPGHVYSECKARVEEALKEFKAANPRTVVTILRPVLVVGPGVENTLANLFRRGWFPCVRGHDPLVQAVHIEDMVRALQLVVGKPLDGVFNVAASDALRASEICRLLRIRRICLPKGLFVAALKVLYAARLSRLPPESVTRFLYSVTVDSTRFQRTFHWEPTYTTKGCMAGYRGGRP